MSARKNKTNSNEYAYFLFMHGVKQKEIAARVGVSEKTISSWKEKENWQAKRAAKTISLEELANKCMTKASQMLDLDITEFDSDAFAKAIAQLKTLLPKNTVDSDIMTFMSFQDMLLEIRTEQGISEEFIKDVTKYQDIYIKRKLGHND